MGTNNTEELTGLKMQNKPRKAVLKSTGELEVIQYNDEIVEFVNCHECNCQHLTHQESYLEIVGNLHVGGTSRGGLLGNGDWKNIGVPVYYFCINNRCLSNYIRKIELKELTTTEQIAEVKYLTVFEVGVPVPVTNEFFLKPDNKYCVVNANREGDIVIEGMIYSIHPQGDYVKHRKMATTSDLIQEWMVKGIVQLVPDTVELEPTERP